MICIYTQGKRTIYSMTSTYILYITYPCVPSMRLLVSGCSLLRLCTGVRHLLLHRQPEKDRTQAHVIAVAIRETWLDMLPTCCHGLLMCFLVVARHHIYRRQQAYISAIQSIYAWPRRTKEKKKQASKKEYIGPFGRALTGSSLYIL